jgi:hypothetical protein
LNKISPGIFLEDYFNGGKHFASGCGFSRTGWRMARLPNIHGWGYFNNNGLPVLSLADPQQNAQSSQPPCLVLAAKQNVVRE